MYYVYSLPNELYHYGIPRKSGRYPWGSGDRPYQSLEVNPGLKKMARASKKIQRISRKVEARRARNNKLYAKVEKLSRSSKEEKQEIAKEKLSKANDRQKKINALENRGKNYYLKMQRKLEKYDLEFDPEIAALGDKFIENMDLNYRLMYARTAF